MVRHNCRTAKHHKCGHKPGSHVHIQPPNPDLPASPPYIPEKRKDRKYHDEHCCWPNDACTCE
jgi:hypothetical protein